MNATTERPRLGFLGAGWIGLQSSPGDHRIRGRGNRRRMRSRDGKHAQSSRSEAGNENGRAVCTSFWIWISMELSSPRRAPCTRSRRSRRWNQGCSVFCQKPLGRSAGEVREMIEAAEAADRLLGVDLSYRHTRGLARIRELVLGGELGDVFAANLVFHNAYGPQSPWFYDARLSGGGCVIDLGIHLVDAALWILDSPVVEVSSRVMAGGIAGRWMLWTPWKILPRRGSIWRAAPRCRWLAHGDCTRDAKR